MEDIHCPYCEREVPVNEINMQRLVARCLECGKLFDLEETPEFAGRAASGASASAFASQPTRAKYAQPKSIKLQESLHGHQMLVRWYGPQYLAMALFCLFWDGFLIVWYAIALSAPKSIGIIALVFPLLHVAAGALITYTCVAGFFNTTTIEVGDGHLRITHGPIPWKGNLELPSADIKQLFVVEKIGSKGSRHYELCALLKDDTKLHLMNQSLDQLRFIEQHLESLLKIRDARVLGEHEG